MSNYQDGFIRQDTHEERGNDFKNISTEMIQTETGRGKKVTKTSIQELWDNIRWSNISTT